MIDPVALTLSGKFDCDKYRRGPTQHLVVLLEQLDPSMGLHNSVDPLVVVPGLAP